MSVEIRDAFQKVIEENILNKLFAPLSSHIANYYPCLDLAYNSNVIENVDQATLVDIELIRVNDITMDGDTLKFKAIIDAEIEIEETVSRNREVDGAQKWFTLVCYAKIDNIPGSISIKSIDLY